jgi:hypothetical protein
MELLYSEPSLKKAFLIVQCAHDASESITGVLRIYCLTYGRLELRMLPSLIL